MDVFQLPEADHRTDIRVRLHSVADLKRSRKLDNTPGELIGNRFEHIETFCAGANLAGVQVCGPAGGAYRDLQIGVAANDEGIVAAKLEVRFLDLLGADLADPLARF